MPRVQKNQTKTAASQFIERNSKLKIHTGISSNSKTTTTTNKKATSSRDDHVVVLALKKEPRYRSYVSKRHQRLDYKAFYCFGVKGYCFLCTCCELAIILTVLCYLLFLLFYDLCIYAYALLAS